MSKKFTIYFILVIIVIGLLQGCKKEGILTNSFGEVNRLQVNYKDFNKIYTIGKDTDLIKGIYYSILNTKTVVHKNPSEMDSQNSDPVCIITIYYKNGKEDIIKSTEGAEFIYRNFDSKGSWIGGKNTDLIGLIKTTN
ncbi:hypothetical protein CPJCM30710_29560 [Clostridium polyendosporum]|uniref:Lipoprotein n=1 Tax=Clostridium polyendosporum TaxID=69208 RepID=A0A919S124_9CLOT|nr:hypothetical protein [Clostridium polyendosporum]GIM30290.1 hypothetical protein CPJCM30710_29560 [Clostridium polyendosporum]